MKDLKEQDAEVRQFLLGQLDEERAEQVEERIFAEPDFAEEVRAVESELIAGYDAGILSSAERGAFEQKYLTSPAGIEVVKQERLFGEFIRGKLREHEPFVAPGSAWAETSRPTETTDLPPATDKSVPKQSLRSPFASLFATRPKLVYSALSACLLLLLAVGLWYFAGRAARETAVDKRAQVERQAAEAELARVNSDAGTPARETIDAVADLLPAHRAGSGAMARINKSGGGGDKYLELRLGLPQAGTPPYQAVFRDDRHKEMFAVPNLTAHDTPQGPQVWLFVPAKHLKGGDYRVDLRTTGKGGGYEDFSSYAFRIVEAK